MTPEQTTIGLGGRLFVLLQHILPQHGLSALMYRATRLRWRRMVAYAIRAYSRAFRVDLSDAAEADPMAYPSFNAFFTRALRPGVRPLPEAADALLSPVDGRVSQAGRIHDGRLLQAKGQDYRLADLLGGDAERAKAFGDGSFVTLYLSPRDYHRIHMPLAGVLTQTIHVPGRLFSVNPTTVAGVPRLFARNERVACLFDTAIGPVALVLVGAIFVGSIETVWAGRITPPRARAVSISQAPRGAVELNRGAEMGRFNMGSTVILLLPKGGADLRRDLAAGDAVQCRSAIGRVLGR